MLERRNNLVSYVVSGLFLFTTVAAWFVLCVPEPGSEFSTAGAIVGSIFVTLTLRVLADVIVRGLEGFSRSRARKRMDRQSVVSLSPGSATPASDAPASTPASGPPSDEVAQESLAGTGCRCPGCGRRSARALAMMRQRKNKVSYFVSALFVLSLPVVSLLVVDQRTSGASSDGSPRCVGYYFGGYFGEVVPPGYGLYEDRITTDDFEPYADEGPKYFRWPQDRNWTEIQTDEFEQEYVTDFDGNKYAIDTYDGDTYYYDGTTRLTTQRGLDIDDPCDPVSVSVKTITRDSETESASDSDDPDFSFPAFSYFDQENNFNQTDLYLNSGGTSIEAYFGSDGRLMPVCSDDKQSLDTCIERSDVYYDSGAYYFIRRMVVAGFLIIGYAIAARLVAGLVVLGLERLSVWRSKRRDGARSSTRKGSRRGSVPEGSDPLVT